MRFLVLNVASTVFIPFEFAPNNSCLVYSYKCLLCSRALNMAMSKFMELPNHGDEHLWRSQMVARYQKITKTQGSTDKM